jgi:hypothetical protein
MDRITKSAPDFTLPAVRRRPECARKNTEQARAMPPDDAFKIVSRGNASRQTPVAVIPQMPLLA